MTYHAPQDTNTTRTGSAGAVLGAIGTALSTYRDITGIPNVAPIKGTIMTLEMMGAVVGTPSLEYDDVAGSLASLFGGGWVAGEFSIGATLALAEFGIIAAPLSGPVIAVAVASIAVGWVVSELIDWVWDASANPTLDEIGKAALADYYDQVAKGNIESIEDENNRLTGKLKAIESWNHEPKGTRDTPSRGPGSYDREGNLRGYGGKSVAPIVLDLNGDGKVDLVSYEESHSDIDVLGTGFKHHAGWVGPNDGLLAIDLDGDGKINKTLEWAFANQTANIEGDTDLEALASLYDSNKDGVLDANDADWAKFRIWQDSNQNGVVDEGEVKTLGEWGITSIQLKSDNAQQDQDGNWVNGYGSYSKGGTSFGIFADVGLAVSDIGFKITEVATGKIVEFKAEDVELGPNPLNDTNRIYKMFQSGDNPLYMSIAQENLDYDIVVGGKGSDVIAVENWNAGIYAKVDQESTKAKQDYIGKSVQELQFRLTLATDQASKDSINAQITQLNAEYLIPVYLGYVLSGGEGNDGLWGGKGDDWLSGDQGYDYIRGLDGDDILFIDSLDDAQGGNGYDIAFIMDNGFDQYHELNLANQSLESVIGGDGNDWVRAGTPSPTNGVGGAATSLGVNIDGGKGDDHLVGGDYNDQIAGGEGKDNLSGGKGDDYIIADELDTIDAGDGVDIVAFTTIESLDIDVSNMKAEIVIGGYNDDRIKTSYDKPVALFGNDGDDFLNGSWGDDTLSGDNGDDVSKGAAGNDTYRFNLGDGRDTLDDQFYYDKEGTSWVNGYGQLYSSFSYSDVRVIHHNATSTRDAWDEYETYTASASVSANVANWIGVSVNRTHADGGTNDKIEFGAGITRDSLIFDLRGNDLYIGIKDAALPAAKAWELSDSLKLTNWLDLWDRIEKAKFVDGTEADIASLYLTAKGLTALPSADYAYTNPLSAGASDATHDVISGTSSDQWMKGGGGNDVYVFNRGSGWDVILDEFKTQMVETAYQMQSQSFILPVQYGHYVMVTKSYWENNDNSATGDTGESSSFASNYYADDGSEENGLWVYYTTPEWQVDVAQVNFAGSWNTRIDSLVWRAQNAGRDVLRIDNIGIQDLALRFNGDDLVVALRDGEKDFWSLSDRITLQNWHDVNYRVEVLRLGNGAWDIDLGSLSFAYAGDKGADIIGGGKGFDWLSGGGGNDILLGDEGSDFLIGGEGDDLIAGGKGVDTIIGGAGIDTIDYSTSDAAVIIDLNGYIGHGGDAENEQFYEVENIIGSAFNDVLTGNGLDNKFIGGKGADIIDGSGGNDWASYQGSSAAVNVNINTLTFTGGDAEGDRLNNIENLIGSDYNDTLMGNSANNILIGGKGADWLQGRGGYDWASYEYATSTVSVNLFQGKGLSGEAYGDTLVAIENLKGSAYDDQLVGDLNLNKLEGGSGDDILAGGGGADNLDGGEGNDDMASYESSALGVNVNLATGLGTGGDAEGDQLSNIENLKGSAFADILTGDAKDNLIQGGVGADIIDGGAGNDWASYVDAISLDLKLATNSDGDILISIENIWGSDFNDSIFANDGNNRLIGGKGIDTISARGGDDWINGGEGNDIMNGGAGIDTLSYSFAKAAVTVDLLTGTASGGDGNDAFGGIENIEGSIWADKLTGNDLANKIEGGFGNDEIKGGKGDDQLIGGLGVDTYKFARGDGNDIIDASDLFPQQDKLIFDTGIATNNLTFGRSGDNLSILLDQSGGQITLNNWFKSSLYQLDRVTLADGKYILGQDISALSALPSTTDPTKYWHDAQVV